MKTKFLMALVPLLISCAPDENYRVDSIDGKVTYRVPYTELGRPTPTEFASAKTGFIFRYCEGRGGEVISSTAPVKTGKKIYATGGYGPSRYGDETVQYLTIVCNPPKVGDVK